MRVERIGKLADRVDDSPDDGGRKAAAMDGLSELTKRVVAAEEKAEQKHEKDAKAAEQARINDIVQDAVKAALKGVRAPSLAETIGQGKPITGQQARMIAKSEIGTSPVLKAIFSDYRAGEVFDAMLDRKGVSRDNPLDLDVSLMERGKAELFDLGLSRMSVGDKSVSYAESYDGKGGLDPNDPSGGFSKATTGASGSTGGYVLPNNLVDTLVKPATQRAVYQNLVTVRNGVNVRGVDQPFRLGAPARMTFQDWNTSKENVNETYGSYTANLGTLARVMDITKQYARFSAGAAEADVMDELTKAAILGENYSMAVGAGTGSVGTGDPTTGIYTALSAVGQVAYKTTFSGASNSTIAGSFATALTQINGALATRSRENQAVVVDAVTYWTVISQGSDAAGFWVSPTQGPTGFTRTESGGLAFWGTPIYYDANFNSNSSTTKVAIAGEWDKLKLYRGLEFRIDSSDVAGTRWDYNLIGFRGEEEIGFNALTAVATGAMQYATAVIP